MTGNANAPPPTAAFFDVDGTLVDSTIVHYYVYFRRQRMAPMAGRLWYAAFLVRCLYYLLIDKLDRSRFNVVFYRNYAGLDVRETKRQAVRCHQDVIVPRRYQQAVACVARHRLDGHRIVLVTGSIDFIVEPLAKELGAESVLAPALVESNGRFTGALDGPPIGAREKARRMQRYAQTHGVELSRSHAYGDSIADLPMLEAVGYPHAVNPDKALAAKASTRGWPMHRWSLAPKRGDRGR